MEKHAFHYYAPITPKYFDILRNQILEAIQTQSVDDLTLFISSEGGDLNTGFTAYNFIRSLPFPVTVVNMGTVESIAVPIYLSGEKRLCLKDSRFLLHSFSYTFGNYPYEMSKILEILQSLKFDVNRYVSIFNERTCSADNRFDIRQCLEGRTAILNDTSAVSCGICTQIVEPTATISAKYVHWWVNS